MDYKVYVKGSYLEIEEIQGTLKYSVLQKDVTVLQHDTDKDRFYFYNVPNFDKLVDIENIKKEDLSPFTVESFVEFYTSLSDGGSGGGGTGGTAIDRELVVTTYECKTAFTGASVGDTITCTQIIDVTASPINVSTIWRNQTTAADLASVPSASNLSLLGSQALTNAQLRAQALNVSTDNFYTEDVEENTATNTTFVGKQTKNGVWLIQKVVDTIVGTTTTTNIQYASVLNNATKTTYASAWSDRATLTYSEIKNLL